MSEEIKNPLDYLKSLCKDEKFLGIDDLPEEFQLFEEGEWLQDYKYQTSSDIYWHTPTDRYFAIDNSRSGSYHTDWYYLTPEVREVRKEVEIVKVISWKDVK